VLRYQNSFTGRCQGHAHYLTECLLCRGHGPHGWAWNGSSFWSHSSHGTLTNSSPWPIAGPRVQCTWQQQSATPRHSRSPSAREQWVVRWALKQQHTWKMWQQHPGAVPVQKECVLCEHMLDVANGSVHAVSSALSSHKRSLAPSLSQYFCMLLSAGYMQQGDQAQLQKTIADRQQYIQKQQRWLLFLRHCAKCQQSEEECQFSRSCRVGKELWQHILTCSNQKCNYPRCVSSKDLLKHHQKCQVGQHVNSTIQAACTKSVKVVSCT
jgi:hypothetical protein